MKHLSEYIHTSLTGQRDLVHLFLGDIISEGSERVIYQHNLNKNFVIKHSHKDGFQNILEWEMWKNVQGTKYKKWFAPCVDISPNGHFLIQEKVEVIPKSQYPKRIPEFFVDLKYKNYGKIGKQFVVFDYGTMHIQLTEIALTKKTKKANWWEE